MIYIANECHQTELNQFSKSIFYPKHKEIILPLRVFTTHDQVHFRMLVNFCLHSSFTVSMNFSYRQLIGYESQR